jgi:type IV secretion system protein VirB4
MSEAVKKNKDLSYHRNPEEYIPYAAHFDEETVITKNGELFQVIKVTGFSFEHLKDGEDEKKSVRQVIREAFLEHVKSDEFSFWVHTIRRQSDISTQGYFKNKHCEEVNEKWIKQNNWRTQFINELYITIVKEGESLPLKNPLNLINNLFIEKELSERSQTYSQSLERLSALTNSVIKSLSSFGARKLSIFKQKGIYYSEIMSFCSKLINLRQENIPLLPADLSLMLTSHNINFKYNTVVTEGNTGKHFGAVYSAKEYREITEEEIDKLIQLPVNFIISQTFFFVHKNEVENFFYDQKKIYEFSGAKLLYEISGLKELYEADLDENIGYGRTQLFITVLEDSVKNLQTGISKVVDVLRNIGLVFVREDLFMEQCYWSSLPANFFLFKENGLISGFIVIVSL